MQQVKRSVHKVVYILLLSFQKLKNVSCEFDRWVVETQLFYLVYTRTAVALVVDARNEVPGVNTVGIIYAR